MQMQLHWRKYNTAPPLQQSMAHITSNASYSTSAWDVASAVAWWSTAKFITGRRAQQAKSVTCLSKKMVLSVHAATTDTSKLLHRRRRCFYSQPEVTKLRRASLMM